MRRIVKAKRLFPRVQLRKSALSASAAARRGYPAWIDASERAVPFPAITVTPRVRDALVLRKVAREKSTTTKGSSHAHGSR
mgnify:CR=1 FL=1